MKRIAILLMVALGCLSTCQVVYGQAKPLEYFQSYDKTAPAGWFDTTVVTSISFQFTDLAVYNNGTDTIYLAKDKDTLYPKYVPVGPGYVQPVWTQLKWLRVKGKSAGQAYKVVTGLGQNARQDRANSAASPAFIQGNTAAAATDAGNPVKVGAVYNNPPATYVSGQRADLQAGSRGALKVQITAPDQTTNLGVSLPNSDAISASGYASLWANGNLHMFNGTTWDRVRNNVEQTVGITASGATTTQTGADQTNYNGRGAVVVLDMTTVGTGSVTLSVQGKDVASGKYYTILTGAAVVTNSTNVYRIYPGLTAVANTTVSDILPRTWRVVVTANNANATTYTVGASVIY